MTSILFEDTDFWADILRTAYFRGGRSKKSNTCKQNFRAHHLLSFYDRSNEVSKDNRDKLKVLDLPHNNPYYLG